MVTDYFALTKGSAPKWTTHILLSPPWAECQGSSTWLPVGLKAMGLFWGTLVHQSCAQRPRSSPACWWTVMWNGHRHNSLLCIFCEFKELLCLCPFFLLLLPWRGYVFLSFSEIVNLEDSSCWTRWWTWECKLFSGQDSQNGTNPTLYETFEKEIN